jgi:hypothetical protein
MNNIYGNDTATLLEIMDGMALAFFASAYADQADDAGQPLYGDIMEQMPAQTDPAAVHAARTLVIALQSANPELFGHWRAEGFADVDGLPYMLDVCRQLPSDGADRELTPELFGHYLAMQAMGHGVGLEMFGDAVRDAITVPYVEFGSHSLECDYF